MFEGGRRLLARSLLALAARIVVAATIVVLALAGLYLLPNLLFVGLIAAEAAARHRRLGPQTTIAVVVAMAAGATLFWFGVWRLTALLFAAAVWVLTNDALKSFRGRARIFSIARDGLAIVAIAFGAFGFLGIPMGFGLLTMIVGTASVPIFVQQERREPQLVKCRICGSEFFLGPELDRCPGCGESNWMRKDGKDDGAREQPIHA